MEKLILKGKGKEVKICNILLNYRDIAPNVVTIQHIPVAHETIPFLLQIGAVEVVDTEVPMELEFYIQKIADRLGWKLPKVYNYLNGIDEMLPAAAFSIVLREVAIELDKKYDDHIQDSEEIYIISLFDGGITKVNKATIKNYRNFAAFRSAEDAKVACKITRDGLKNLFKSGK